MFGLINIDQIHRRQHEHVLYWCVLIQGQVGVNIYIHYILHTVSRRTIG